MTVSTDGMRGMEPTLIFPGGMPRSLEYLKKSLDEGRNVIGASSVEDDSARPQYPSWLHLPYITEGSFPEALRAAVKEKGIRGVFTPNPVVWNFLKANLSDIAPDVALVNASPVDAELSGFREARRRAEALRSEPLELPLHGFGQQPAAGAIELAALYRHAEVIPGMCDHDKLKALHEIARSTVIGDVVEIGSWWGKSAFILLRLAQLYGIGKVLCVDPWEDVHLVQHDSTGLVDAYSDQVRASEAFDVFQMNLLPYSGGDLNYMRMPSVDGAAAYRASRDVKSSTFGETRYAGAIAVLHVDGNHMYESAVADLEAWTPLVSPGGWLVVDDYVWCYGDGPQRAGDEFVERFRQSIGAVFVMGTSLFVQIIKPIRY